MKVYGTKNIITQNKISEYMYDEHFEDYYDFLYEFRDFISADVTGTKPIDKETFFRKLERDGDCFEHKTAYYPFNFSKVPKKYENIDKLYKNANEILTVFFGDNYTKIIQSNEIEVTKFDYNVESFLIIMKEIDNEYID